MAPLKRIKTKKLVIFLFATLTYALCQMLFSIILMKEDLWSNFHIQLSAHYVVIFTMCIADYGLLLFLNRYLPYSRNIFYRIVAGLVGVTLISLLLVWIFNYFIYEILLIPKEGMPSYLIKFALALVANIPILLL